MSDNSVNNPPSEDVRPRKGKRASTPRQCNDQGRIECRYCGRTYSSGENASRHEREHKGPPSHECPTCDSVFYRKDILKKHMKIHDPPETRVVNPNNPVCSKCEKDHSKCARGGAACVYDTAQPAQNPRPAPADAALPAPASSSSAAASSVPNLSGADVSPVAAAAAAAVPRQLTRRPNNNNRHQRRPRPRRRHEANHFQAPQPPLLSGHGGYPVSFAVAAPELNNHGGYNNNPDLNPDNFFSSSSGGSPDGLAQLLLSQPPPPPPQFQPLQNYVFAEPEPAPMYMNPPAFMPQPQPQPLPQPSYMVPHLSAQLPQDGLNNSNNNNGSWGGPNTWDNNHNAVAQQPSAARSAFIVNDGNNAAAAFMMEPQPAAFDFATGSANGQQAAGYHRPAAEGVVPPPPPPRQQQPPSLYTNPLWGAASPSSPLDMNPLGEAEDAQPGYIDPACFRLPPQPAPPVRFAVPPNASGYLGWV